MCLTRAGHEPERGEEGPAGDPHEHGDKQAQREHVEAGAGVAHIAGDVDGERPRAVVHRVKRLGAALGEDLAAWFVDYLERLVGHEAGLSLRSEQMLISIRPARVFIFWCARP